ncbi:hypothetical protein POM88_028488 [Heracleum sosnowskyi]|uniref:Uncharacterized protein n=1 Tax=Heracleum sosnowskyi TaxID=360622 RepID=A0AAD8HUH2_9APIA|nr:hypothetical protein POM88_028488 [Heracleum sosnowskyi]
MTDHFAVLAAIAQNAAKPRDDLLIDFYSKWQHEFLVDSLITNWSVLLFICQLSCKRWIMLSILGRNGGAILSLFITNCTGHSNFWEVSLEWQVILQKVARSFRCVTARAYFDNNSPIVIITPL